ncbi:MAG TPA: sodium:proton antiporter [Myxococcota bacterium]|jgi:Na+/H+ antiporter NhaD/arsenite permease-like protein|nr:sodium:proton antiporter [Myxococcota bacterium]
MGATLSLAWVAPFAAMLLGIAALPLAAPRLWEKNRWKAALAAVLGVPVGVFFLRADPALLAHTAADYASFIVLLGALYVISGGIVIRGGVLPTPAANTAVLALGAVLASFMGTTGASMLLVRPLLTINESRRHRVHTVVFFIFLVANVGGCLTPLGDPPLFMGYLKGVPFAWTLGLWKVWLFAVAALLAAYYAWDRRLWNAEAAAASAAAPGAAFEPQGLRDPGALQLAGKRNFPLLAGVVLVVAVGQQLPALFGSFGLREVFMAALAVASWVGTPAGVRRENRFTFAPIVEVATLFAGIFLTMMPALAILAARGGELGLHHPAQFFWATGALSSFLDNAPTYLVFFALAQGLTHAAPGTPGLVAGVPPAILAAISAGAVFMGANTYIGNGPNFMVKAIADERGVRMPTFFGYMGYSLAVLVPLFVVVTFLFLR